MFTAKAVFGGTLGWGLSLMYPPAFGVAYGVSERPFWGAEAGVRRSGFVPSLPPATLTQWRLGSPPKWER
jgi:hypothetical protein